MPAPTSYPDWDTNGTNTAAIVAGHATGGFVNNEIPTAAELNQVLMLIGLWIRWLQGITTKIRTYSALLGQSFGAGTFPSGASIGRWVGSTSGDELYIPITTTQGERITQIDVWVQGDAVATLSVSLVDQFLSTGLRSDVVTSAASATTQTLSITTMASAPLAEDVTSAQAVYYVHVHQGGTGTPAVLGCRVTTTRP